jgi:uncharacterized membrane protein
MAWLTKLETRIGVDARAAARELREADSPEVRRKRKIGWLSALAIADFTVIALYQTGVIRHLPDPPWRVFDSDAISGSREAYPLGVPDAALALVYHGVVWTLAGAGGSARSGRSPRLDVALGAAACAGAAAALAYLVEMTRMRRVCVYCLTAAGLELATFGWAVPGAWRGRGRR